jgi:hypothetical protein
MNERGELEQWHRQENPQNSETELSQCYLIKVKSHIDWPGIESVMQYTHPPSLQKERYLRVM